MFTVPLFQLRLKLVYRIGQAALILLVAYSKYSYVRQLARKGKTTHN